jgi:hypothetical protein
MLKIKLLKNRSSSASIPTGYHGQVLTFRVPSSIRSFFTKSCPKAKSCRLDFVGLQIEYNDEKKLAKREIEMLAEKLRNEDSAAWKLLTKEMEKELGEKG